MNYVIYLIWMAFFNAIRGGTLKFLWNNTLGWKIIASVGVIAITILILKQSILMSLGIGIAWFLFMLPAWGAWIDMGHFPPEYTRGGILTPIYKFLGSHIQNQETVDLIMLSLRGLLVVLIFGWIAFMKGSYFPLTLVIPIAIMWAYGYDLAWKINPNLGEYLSGAIIGIGIIIALL